MSPAPDADASAASAAASAAAAALQKGDAEFTPTLWTADGPVETTAPDPPAGDAAAAPPLSKNARKRLAKQEAWEAKKRQKKEEEKSARKAKGVQVRAEHAQKLEAMTAEERAAYEETRRAAREARMRDAEAAKAKKMAALEAPHAVVLDLEFSHLMDEKEMRSLAKQLAFCYAANTKAKVQTCMHITGLGGAIGAVVRKHCSGFDKWAAHREDGAYIDALAERKADLVYLTADSDCELTEFKPGEVYVIGGIVDRNRHKNLTLNKANEQGIRHARLPIRDHLKMTGTHILTVNQTMDIVHASLELGDWEKALERVVPLRKHRPEEEGEEKRDEEKREDAPEGERSE